MEMWSEIEEDLERTEDPPLHHCILHHLLRRPWDSLQGRIGMKVAKRLECGQLAAAFGMRQTFPKTRQPLRSSQK